MKLLFIYLFIKVILGEGRIEPSTSGVGVNALNHLRIEIQSSCSKGSFVSDSRKANNHFNWWGEAPCLKSLKVYGETRRICFSP